MHIRIIIKIRPIRLNMREIYLYSIFKDHLLQLGEWSVPWPYIINQLLDVWIGFSPKLNWKYLCWMLALFCSSTLELSLFSSTYGISRMLGPSLGIKSCFRLKYRPLELDFPSCFFIAITGTVFCIRSQTRPLFQSLV